MFRSLADSHVTVLGYGSIGRALASRLLACGAVVTAVASAPRDDDLVGRVVTAADVDWAAQHVVVVVLPLTDATRHVVDAAFLARLSDDALVVNVGRGPLLDTAAVIAEAGRLRFALDVTDPEPLPDGHPLWSAPGVSSPPMSREVRPRCSPGWPRCCATSSPGTSPASRCATSSDGVLGVPFPNLACRRSRTPSSGFSGRAGEISTRLSC